MSLPALELRKNGRVEPQRENLAIKHLRDGKSATTEALLGLLVQEDDDAWTMPTGSQATVPQLVYRNYRGFSIVLYRGTWFGVPTGEGSFDPLKVQHQQYSQCLVAPSRAELMAQVARQRRLGAMVLDALRRVPILWKLKAYGKRLFNLVYK
jgi:hypothetical protein